MTPTCLPADFFARDAVIVARELLGARLVQPLHETHMAAQQFDRRRAAAACGVAGVVFGLVGHQLLCLQAMLGFSRFSLLQGGQGFVALALGVFKQGLQGLGHGGLGLVLALGAQGFIRWKSWARLLSSAALSCMSCCSRAFIWGCRRTAVSSSASCPGW